MAFLRCAAVLALLAAAAGALDDSAALRQALDSDDACASASSGDCALRLLQFRSAAASRQPAEQTFEEKIKEASVAEKMNAAMQVMEAAPTPSSASEERPVLELAARPAPGPDRVLPWEAGTTQLAQGPLAPEAAGDELQVLVDSGSGEISRGGVAGGEAAPPEEAPLWAQLSLAAQSSPAALAAVELSLVAQNPPATPATEEPPVVAVDTPTAPLAAEAAPAPQQADVPPPSAGSGYGHPTWLQSCKKILLDLGSGSGQHVRMMYEPETFTKSNAVLVIQQIFGNPNQRELPSSETGICVLGLEPDLQYAAALEELRRNYTARGWNVHFYPFAAWSSDGLTNADIVESQPGTLTSVRTVDIADFARSLPPSFGVRMMIMDMDGAEYESIAHLLENTMMCQSIIKSLLVSASQQGNVTRWADPAISKFGSRSIRDVKKRVSSQHCKGKTTPVMDLVEYAVPLPR